MTPRVPSDTSTVSHAADQRTVITVVQLLAGAVKHHSLYPEDHSIARQHLGKIWTTITAFLEHHPTLHLDIDKTDILYDGDIVYTGKTDENDLAFLLGRDGVEWLEFSRDIEQEEIQALLRVITSNRRSDIEQDGNIATALWEQDFPHLEYKTIDLTAMDIPLLNFSSFQVAPGPETADTASSRPGDDARWQDYYSDDAGEDHGHYQEEQETASLALTSPETALWQLSELEQVQLDILIRKEEGGPDTESTIEILLILLLLQNNLQEAVDIMDFLQDRFLFSMQQHEFKNGLKILGTLNKIKTIPNKRQEQLSPLISNLFVTVSRPESLRDLERFFSAPDQSVPDKELEALWALLRILPPEVLKGLAPLSTKIDIQRFGPSFLALFEYFCELDPQHFAAVAAQIDTKICLHLFPFLSRIHMDNAVPVLSALAFHPSHLVRSKAFQLLDQWGAVDLELLLPLIDDPDEAIRTTMLSRIGRQRSPALEDLLCKHMAGQNETTAERDHILACYQALGRTGSSRSIDFLKKTLLEGSRLGTLFAAGGGAHKEGAARALLALRSKEAKKIVKDGASSMIPDVRSACRKALGGRHA